MTNALYGKGREKFLNADIDWAADTIKVALIDTAFYTVSIDSDEFYSSVSSAVVGTPITLSSKTSTLGVADAADVSWTGLISAPSIEALVIYKDTGVEATSPLIAYIDTATGLPAASGAADIDVVWDNGSNKIFKL